jgi:hypothetical protein
MTGNDGGWKREMAGKRKQSAVVVFVFCASGAGRIVVCAHPNNSSLIIVNQFMYTLRADGPGVI